MVLKHDHHSHLNREHRRTQHDSTSLREEHSHRRSANDLAAWEWELELGGKSEQEVHRMIMKKMECSLVSVQLARGDTRCRDRLLFRAKTG